MHNELDADQYMHPEKYESWDVEPPTYDILAFDPGITTGAALLRFGGETDGVKLVKPLGLWEFPNRTMVLDILKFTASNSLADKLHTVGERYIMHTMAAAQSPMLVVGFIEGAHESISLVNHLGWRNIVWQTPTQRHMALGRYKPFLTKIRKARGYKTDHICDAIAHALVYAYGNFHRQTTINFEWETTEPLASTSR